MRSPSKEQFVQLIQEHQNIITSLCKIYYAEEEDQKDTRQDILLQLWKSIPNFRNECKISTWIYKVALNTILSKAKKEKRNIATEPLVNDFESSGSVFFDDEVKQLQHIISMLNHLDKAIVVLYLEGYSNKEIAATLNFTETNISTRFNRIKIRLQKIYKTQQPYELR